MDIKTENASNGWTIVQTKRTKRMKKDKVKAVKKEVSVENSDVKPKIIGRKKSKYGTFKNKDKYLPKNKNNDNKKKYTFLEKLKYKLSTANLSIDEEKSLILKIKEIEDKGDDTEDKPFDESKIQNQMCNFCKNLGKNNYKGHIAKNCTILKSYQCTKCGDQGHTRKYCKNSYKPRCHYCKEFGHIIKLCPILERNDDDSIITELPETIETETIIVE